MRASPWILASFTASVAACHIVGGTDGLYIDESSTAGTGAASATSTTSSAGGAAGGGQGTGGRPECIDDDECDTGDATVCSFPRCVNGACEVAVPIERTECDFDDGNVCNAGECVECNTSADCPGQNIAACIDQFCIAEGCDSGMQDPGETGVDCGGSCAPCPNGSGCFANSDCQSSLCDDMQCNACSDHPDCGPDRYCDPDRQACENQLPYWSDCEEGYQCKTGSCCEIPFVTTWCC